MKFYVSFTILSIFSNGFVNAVTNHYFPKNFKFGVATAAYQVEGAWNTDGKGENIWDRLTHTDPSKILNGDNGDIACDSYHKYKEDIALLKDLGVNHYRFSLSWSRILPSGYTNKINEAGVNYYKNILKELKENNIEPMVTLYHWDLPQPLQDIGGWPNPLLAEHFGNYARVAFETFGDDVKYWATFNEVLLTCQGGYGSGSKAPMINATGLADYLCTHTILKAHANAYHIYDEEFREKQNGKVSIVLNSDWFEPGSDSEEDENAAETRRQFTFGWFANPIFHGNYPKIMIDRVKFRSEKEGFPKSRLPEFTPEEIDFIKGTHDYIGVNTYTSALVNATSEASFGTPSMDKDIGTRTYKDPSWEESASDWLRITPWGTRKLLRWIKNTYDNPEIIITENGVSDFKTMDDEIRIDYLREYLSNIHDAMYEDGVNVTGYTAWSLMDNFEWNKGYNEKFGLYSVDFSSANRTRTPKKSVEYYKHVIKTHCLLDKCED